MVAPAAFPLPESGTCAAPIVTDVREHPEKSGGGGDDAGRVGQAPSIPVSFSWPEARPARETIGYAIG